LARGREAQGDELISSLEASSSVDVRAVGSILSAGQPRDWERIDGPSDF
jgi:hypothetical protein